MEFTLFYSIWNVWHCNTLITAHKEKKTINKISKINEILISKPIMLEIIETSSHYKINIKK